MTVTLTSSMRLVDACAEKRVFSRPATALGLSCVNPCRPPACPIRSAARREAPRCTESERDAPDNPARRKGMSDGPSFKPDLLGSATVTILCRPIREVRVARPRVRRDRLGAHASGGGFDETARRGVTCEDPAPVRSRPRWSRRIPTRIAHGIGHDHAWVFMDSIGNKAVNPKLAESAPNSHGIRITGSTPMELRIPPASRLRLRRAGPGRDNEADSRREKRESPRSRAKCRGCTSRGTRRKALVA